MICLEKIPHDSRKCYNPRVLGATKCLFRLRSGSVDRFKQDYSPPSLYEENYVIMSKKTGKKQRAATNRNTENYFKVEISSKCSDGSDDYSVIQGSGEICSDSDGKEITDKDTKDNDDDDDAMTDYSLIDCAGQVPRSLTCSPLSLPSLLAGPDLVQDLPRHSGNKVTRTSSQVQGNKYRLMSREMQNVEEQPKFEREDVCDRQSGRRPGLRRSVSALPERLQG